VLVGILYTIGAGIGFTLLLMLAGTYLADVRPAVRAMRGGGRPQNPYNSW